MCKIQDVSWQGYLVASGFSTNLSTHSSQVLLPGWGERQGAPASVLEKSSRRHPFWDDHVLIVKSKQVNVSERCGNNGFAKFQADATLSTCQDIVPHCACAMGAFSVTVVKAITEDTDIYEYDYVIVADGADVPDSMKNNDRIVNVEYMKQCLVSARALILGLDKGTNLHCIRYRSSAELYRESYMKRRKKSRKRT